MVEIPVWVATILVGAVLGIIGSFVKMILSLGDRVTRIEAKLWPNGKERA